MYYACDDPLILEVENIIPLREDISGHMLSKCLQIIFTSTDRLNLILL